MTSDGMGLCVDLKARTPSGIYAPMQNRLDRLPIRASIKGNFSSSSSSGWSTVLEHAQNFWKWLLSIPASESPMDLECYYNKFVVTIYIRTSLVAEQ
jgi:hypothetical protein